MGNGARGRCRARQTTVCITSTVYGLYGHTGFIQYCMRIQYLLGEARGYMRGTIMGHLGHLDSKHQLVRLFISLLIHSFLQ